MQTEQYIKEQQPSSTNTEPIVYEFTLKATGNYTEIKWFEKEIEKMFNAIPNK